MNIAPSDQLLPLASGAVLIKTEETRTEYYN